MTQKEFIKQVEKEANDRLKKRFEERGVLTSEDILEERAKIMDKLGFNSRIALECNLLKNKMENLHETFKVYKKGDKEWMN